MRFGWRRRGGGGQDPPEAGVEVRDEVEFHLVAQIADLVAEGWPPDEARAEAVRRFGDRGRIEGEMLRIDRRMASSARRVRLLADVRQDVRQAFRQLRRRPWFALATVSVLALGVGANAAVFSVVDGALFRPLPLPDAEALVRVFDVQDGEPGFPASLPEFDDWSRNADFVAASIAYATSDVTWTDGDMPESLGRVVWTGDPAGTVAVSPLLGRWLTREEVDGGMPVVMLSESFWRSRFGGRPEVLGRSLRLGGQSYTVVGVLPAAADVLRPDDPPQLWSPLARSEAYTRGNHFLEVLARLQPGVSADEAAGRAEVMAAAIREGGETEHGIHVAAMRESLVRDARTGLITMLGAVGFVLLIVCANVANLMLSRSLERSREFAVRAALGAGRWRIVRQVVTETVLLGLLGGAGGVAIALLISDVVRSISPSLATLAVSPFDGRVLAFTALTSLAVALLVGSWPALRVGRSDPGAAMRIGGDVRTVGARSGSRTRRLLVAFEVAVSVILLAAAGLLVRSMTELLEEEKGFDPAGVLTFTVRTQGDRYDADRQGAFFEQLLQRLRTLPGVVSAAATSHLPLGPGDTSGGFLIEGRDTGAEIPYAKKRVVSAGYFEALDIPVLRGRAFDERDRAGSRDVVIVSESVANRYWPGEDPVGRQMRFSWGPGEVQEIVGVVGDVKHDGLDRPAEGTIFRPSTQFPRPAFAIVLETASDPIALADAARRVLVDLDPVLPIDDVRTMEDVVSASVASRRTTMLLLGGFAAIALLLATVGVYAVTAQSVTHRTREFGLRLAVGARSGDVLRMVLREELAVVVLGVGAGLVGAAAITRVLSSALFGISPRDPLTFIGAVALLVAAATAAMLIPARRVTRIDPLRALHTE
jgi:predicted permease